MKKNTTKRTIRRNLPINDTYTLIKSYYNGGLLDGNGECCENCNKPLANVAVIQNSNKKQFTVGMDCAATLTGIKFTEEFQQAEYNFNESKAIRAKINRDINKYPNATIQVSNTRFGKIRISVELDLRTCVNESIDKDLFFTYLPDYADRIINPEKNDFKPVATESDLNDYDFSNLCHRDGFESQIINLHGFEIILSNTMELVNNHFNKFYQIQIFENDIELDSDRFYMNRDIKSRIINAINHILFERFNHE